MGVGEGSKLDLQGCVKRIVHSQCGRESEVDGLIISTIGKLSVFSSVIFRGPVVLSS